MVTIIVFGIPDDFPEGKRLKLCSRLCGTVQGTQSLGLGLNEVNFFSSSEVLKKGLGEEIVIFVEGMKTDSLHLREAMAKVLGRIVESYFPDARVRCTVRAFNPLDGVWEV